MFLHSTIATKLYSNMQINYSFWLTFISTLRDLYCAMEGQVCSAPLHVSLTRRISQRSEAAAFLSAKPREQWCFPAEQHGRGAGPWHGGQPIAYPGMVSFVRQRLLDVVCRLFLVNVICLTVTCEREHPVPRSGPTWNQSQIGVFDAHPFSPRVWDVLSYF